MDTSPFITSDPELLGGTSVFAGTREPVRILFENLESGAPLVEFLDDFPSVTRVMAQGVLLQAIELQLNAHPA